MISKAKLNAKGMETIGGFFVDAFVFLSGLEWDTLNQERATRQAGEILASLLLSKNYIRRNQMIPQIKKILYTTDLSDNSTDVFRYAMNSAKKYGARIIILHVLEQLSTNVAALTQAYLIEGQLEKISEGRLAYAKDRIHTQLKMFCEKELENDPDCTQRVEAIELCEGFPPDVILRKADEFNCDMIVMGTHSKGMIGNTFLGSNAKRVLRRTRKPVFVIPLPKGESDTVVDDM